ncbi:MAG TPA: hypothetical protein VED66_06970 [Candidatus Sulfotelmatobacter sp.]|nr:hypothetical protein [Candidatus Sulfotelmatobacter sp.]
MARLLLRTIPLHLSDGRVGSARAEGNNAANQQIFDVSHFSSLVVKIVENHGLKRRTAAEFQAKDDRLNSVYRERINDVMSGWEEQLKDPDYKGQWADLRQKKAEYPGAAKKAQRLWIKLQEPWKELCQEL